MINAMLSFGAALFRNTAAEMVDQHEAQSAEEREKHGLNMLSAMCDARDEDEGKSRLSRQGAASPLFHARDLSICRDY